MRDRWPTPMRRVCPPCAMHRRWTTRGRPTARLYRAPVNWACLRHERLHRARLLGEACHDTRSVSDRLAQGRRGTLAVYSRLLIARPDTGTGCLAGEALGV